MKRREFLYSTGTAAGFFLVQQALPKACANQGMAPEQENNAGQYSSPYMQLELALDAPGFVSWNIDGLGFSRRGANVIQPLPPPSEETYRTVHRTQAGMQVTEYWALNATSPAWTVAVKGAVITLTSEWAAAHEPRPFPLRFNLNHCYATLLGLLGLKGGVALPAVLHLPGQGSVRITAEGRQKSVAGYTASLEGDDDDCPAGQKPASGCGGKPRKPMDMTLPAATRAMPKVIYRLEVLSIYTRLKGIDHDKRFDSYRRNWLNVLQLNPTRRLLANNTASDSCGFCYYEYADIAAATPPLADGLHALDIVRQTLDVAMTGPEIYGVSNKSMDEDFSDTLPSFVIAAHVIAKTGRYDDWLKTNYASIKGWADGMLATDKDNSGLIEYYISGNSGIWPDGDPPRRPSNWWDDIGFGHQDAYANALAYRALEGMQEIAARAGHPEDVATYRAAAEKLHAVYFKTFYNPETGVLGGWRSSDGQLHDYYFLWVNGIAILYGLVPEAQANAIMDKLMAKMKEVGYTDFHMGLPGNLISIALKDYVHKYPDGHRGGGVRPDNADGFQNYQNGGATGCFAYFTLAALYKLGRKEEADAILFPMLDEYGRGGFEGRGAAGRSNDWRRWDGTPMGYEGFLVDNYYTLLAVNDRQKRWPS